VRPSKKSKQQRKSIRIVFDPHFLVTEYQFLSNSESFKNTQTFVGKVCNLSMGGASIQGPIPEKNWLLCLGDQDILVRCNIRLRTGIVKTVSQVRWIEKTDQSDIYQFGLKFTKLDIASQALLGKFIIRKQIDTRKLNRTKELLTPDYYEVYDEADS